MKKLLTLLFFAVLATATFGQQYTVLDTTYQLSEKARIVTDVLNRMETNLIRSIDKEKVKTDTILNLAETRQLMIYFWNGAKQYNELFIKVDSLMYEKLSTDPYIIQTGQTLAFDYFLNANDSTQIGLIHEWDSYNKRILELQGDTDIKYVDAVDAFKDIKEKQVILEKRYNQIKAQ